MPQKQKPDEAPNLQVGEPFNPFALFAGIFVPDAIVGSRLLSPGAKLAYARLMRYAGRNATCFPSMQKLGTDLGVSARQARTYVRELERAKLIHRKKRYNDQGQTSNAFDFLWLDILGDSMKKSSGAPEEGFFRYPSEEPSAEENQTKESHCFKEINYDQDCIPRCAEKTKSRNVASKPSVCKQYPTVREYLERYMQLPGDEKEYPTDRMVVDIMDAAGTQDEDELIEALDYFYNQRGLKPGTKNGPKTFAWFKTVIADHFTKKRDRESAANPCGYHKWEDRNALTEQQFDSMTGAL